MIKKLMVYTAIFGFYRGIWALFGIGSSGVFVEEVGLFHELRERVSTRTLNPGYLLYLLSLVPVEVVSRGFHAAMFCMVYAMDPLDNERVGAFIRSTNFTRLLLCWFLAVLLIQLWFSTWQI